MHGDRKNPIMLKNKGLPQNAGISPGAGTFSEASRPGEAKPART